MTSGQSGAPVALHEHAHDNLLYIREAMERSGTFTAVPGWGTVAVGVTAAGALLLAGTEPTSPRWLVVWLAEAAVAAIISGCAILAKARKVSVSLTNAAGRRFALAFFPSVFAAVALTGAVVSAGSAQLLPSLWLLMYGTAVMAGGALSVRIVPVMGLVFALAGLATLAVPTAVAALIMGCSFSLFHVVFGIIIARTHGG